MSRIWPHILIAQAFSDARAGRRSCTRSRQYSCQTLTRVLNSPKMAFCRSLLANQTEAPEKCRNGQLFSLLSRECLPLRLLSVRPRQLRSEPPIATCSSSRVFVSQTGDSRLGAAARRPGKAGCRRRRFRRGGRVAGTAFLWDSNARGQPYLPGREVRAEGALRTVRQRARPTVEGMPGHDGGNLASRGQAVALLRGGGAS